MIPCRTRCWFGISSKSTPFSTSGGSSKKWSRDLAVVVLDVRTAHVFSRHFPRGVWTWVVQRMEIMTDTIYSIYVCVYIYIYACCMLYARHIILSLASSPVWFSSSFATGVVKPTINHIPFCNTRWVLPHCHFYWKVSMFCMGSLESMADLRRGELAAQRIWGQTIRGSRVERAKKKDISKKFRENTSKIMKWNYHYILESDYPLFGCPPCFSF